MEKTTLGRTELRISRLGAGLSEIGGLSLENENDVSLPLSLIHI